MHVHVFCNLYISFFLSTKLIRCYSYHLSDNENKMSSMLAVHNDITYSMYSMGRDDIVK